VNPRVLVTGDDPGLHIGTPCSLYIDLPPERPGLTAGDWVVTEAGSRYLVAAARRVRPRPRRPRDLVRWHMTVHRLPKHCAVPADVRAVELRWYRR
jgi:hypothetical protein